MIQSVSLDPGFFQDPSGCTAVSALLTLDGRIIVVSSDAWIDLSAWVLTRCESLRPTLVTRDQS